MVLAQNPVKSGTNSTKEMTTGEFVVFLMEKFGMLESQAKTAAFHHPPDQRELIVILNEEMPKISFRAISNLLRQHPLDNIYKNLRVLEEREIPLSIRLLGIPPVTLEKNIETIEKNGYDPKQFIPVLGADPSNLKENIETCKKRNINPTYLIPILILGASPPQFMEFLETPPAERTIKYGFLAVARYAFTDDAMKKHFYDLVTTLNPHEQKAFNEIGQKIENRGYITKKEMQEIFKQHVASHYPDAVLSRLDNILSSFVKDRGFERWEEMAMSDRSASLHKKLITEQELARRPAWEPAKQELPGPTQEEKKATLEYLNRLLPQYTEDVRNDIMLLLRGPKEKQWEIIRKYEQDIQKSQT